MTTLLNQALILTLVGMGMTFAALGLLVLGMYALTALFTDRPRRSEPPRTEVPVEPTLITQVADVALQLATFAAQPGAVTQPTDEDRYRAAAAAVAHALALESDVPYVEDRYRAAAAAIAVACAETESQPAPGGRFTAPETWNNHTRAQHLTRSTVRRLSST